MKRFLIVCGVMLALLLVAAAVAGGDTSTNAYVVSCTPTSGQDPYPHVYDGDATGAQSYVTSHQGCWQTYFVGPVPTTTTTTTEPPTTTTVPPTTTTTTTTTLPVKKRTWVKWCAKHPTYIGKRCPTHKRPIP